ncbi:MAG: penicillin-binding protein 2 [Thermodesulfobacteriota bacterium]
MTQFFQRYEPRELKNRVYYAMAIAIFAFSILFSMFWYLQIIKGTDFREMSKNNRVRLKRIPAQRGKIFDRNGGVLVENRPAFILTVVPEDVRDWKELKARLSTLIAISGEEIQDRLDKAKGRPHFEPVVLKRDLSWEEVASIETFKIDLSGISLDIEPRRFYPHKKLASHLLGYVGEVDIAKLKTPEFADYSRGELIGKDGVEERMERYLRGTKGGRQVEVNATGRVKEILYQIEPLSGKEVYLTIDIELQRIAEETIGEKVGSVIALDPQTGRVLAMVSSPSFDPNLFAGGISKEDWDKLMANPFRILENKAIQGQYPPASTFKVVTAAAALEEEIITPDTEIFSGGSYRLGRSVFRDWREEGHGYIDIYDAIVESADTFFYQIGLSLGVDSLAKYSSGFGLGRETGILLNNEKKGLVPTSKWKRRFVGERWYDGETLTIAIGQGYSLATPLQMLNLFSAIANGGKLFVPQIVESIDINGRAVSAPFTPKEIGRLPISPENLNIIKDALLGVVEEDNGTGRIMRIKGVKVAGKTGTAQVVRLREDDKNKEVPYEFRDHSWFVGFAPFEKPEIAVAVLVEHGGYGAVTAAPIAKKVIKAYLMKKTSKKKMGTITGTVKSQEANL